MKILAYQVDSKLNQTGFEKILKAPSVRWAANHICATVKGCRMGYNTVVYQGEYKWVFQILEQ